MFVSIFCSLPFYTTFDSNSYIPPTFKLKRCLLLTVIEVGGGGGGGGGRRVTDSH